MGKTDKKILKYQKNKALQLHESLIGWFDK